MTIRENRARAVLLSRASMAVSYTHLDVYKRQVLHRGNPEPKNRLAAAGHFIHQTEDQLPFPPGVTGIDDSIHVGSVPVSYTHLLNFKDE